MSSEIWPVRAARLALQLLLPVVLLLTGVRLLLTPTFVRLEYRMPGFPADPYGFTLQDRLRWAPIALDYLLNDAGIAYLADLRFDAGEAVYNGRELRHMQDVKRLTQAALGLWLGALAAGAGLLLALGRTGHAQAAWQGLRGGAKLTLVLMLVLAGGLALGFSFVFVGFHRLFFTGDTWLFYYSDTLIRLFPERFWQDAFAAIAAATLLMAAAIYWLARARLRPRP